MESLKSARSFNCSAMPKDEPIKKQALLKPLNLICANFSAKASEESGFASGVNTQNHAPFGILEIICSASFSKPFLISVGVGSVDKRYSGSSII